MPRGLSTATITQVRNKAGRIKRNYDTETKKGLRSGILNVGTLREKEEYIILAYPVGGTKQFENPRHIGNKREDDRKKELSIMIMSV